MKKFLALLFVFIFCFHIPASLAESVEQESDNKYLKKMPYYYEMQEERILIGTTSKGVDIYEFEYVNPMYDYSGCFRLLNPDEVEKQLKKRNIAYTDIKIMTVMAHDFLVITLIDGENYGFDLLLTSDEVGYITMEALRVFCVHYFGNGYDFFGV